MKKNATVEDFLNKVCLEHELAPSEHFLRVKKKKEMPDSKFFVPQRSDLLDSYVSSASIRTKCFILAISVPMLKFWGKYRQDRIKLRALLLGVLELP